MGRESRWVDRWLLDLIVEEVLGDGRMTGSQITPNLISEPHRVSVRTPRLRTLTQYP
jgi:hypothetical protein